MRSDQKIIDELAESPNGFLSANESIFDMVDEVLTEIQVRTIPLDPSKWLVLISSDPDRDYLTYDLKDLKLAAIMVASGDSYAIEHVVSGFIHPMN